MTNKKLTDVSDEELVKNEKKIKALALVFTGVMVLLFAVTILSLIKKGFSASTLTPVALLPLLIISLNNWNELKKEKKARGL